MQKTTKKNIQSLQHQLTSGGLPTELLLHVRKSVYPGIQYLIRTAWFQQLRSLILPHVFSNTRIDDMDTREFRCLNILGYLAEFLGSEKPTVELAGRKSEIEKLMQLLSDRNWQLDNKSRYQLRKLLEIDTPGRQIKTDFFNWIKNHPSIELDNQLLLNPFTSLINLAEIYSQVKYKTVVNWSCASKPGIKHLVLAGKPNQLEIFTSTNACSEQEALIYCQIMAMFNLFLNNDNNPVPLSIYRINYRKEFMQVKDKNDLVFTSSEINTGVCNGVSIVISRQEESAKTLIHELIHFHNLDFKYETPELDKLVKKITNGNLATSQTGSTGTERFNIGEAHTECLASILYILLNTYTEPEQAFTNQFIDQIIYTLAKQSDILQIAGCSSIQHPTCQLRESTNLYSYFFIKSYLYFQLRDWLDGCCTGPKFRHQSPTAYRKLQRIILAGSQNPLIHQVVAYFKSHRNTASTNMRNFRTLKMMANAT